MSGAETRRRSLGAMAQAMAGRGALPARRSRTERGGGAPGRENAGMSSERGVRIPPAEYPRFPG